MANTDKTDGPSGFRRIFQPIADFFSGGGTGPLVVSTAPGGASGTQVPAAAKYARARYANDPGVKTRVDATKAKLQVWENKSEELIKLQLKASLHPENFALMQFIIHKSTNVMRRVISDISILYENPAKRELISTVTQVDVTAAEQDVAEVTGEPVPTEPVKPVIPGTEQGGEPPEPGGVLNTSNPDVNALAEVLDLTGSTSEKGKTPFEKAMKAYDWDVLLSVVERYARFLPAVWVRPIVTGEPGTPNTAGENTFKSGTEKLTYVIYTPAVADVVEDDLDPTQAKAFWYWASEVDANGVPHCVIWFWQKDWLFKFNDQWNLLSQTPNKLGRLPVTVFRIDQPVGKYYLDGTGDDLFDGTIEQCVLKTLQNARVRDSAFKQLAIQGDPDKVPADQVMGGPSPIFLGEEATASVLDMQPALEQYTNLCKEREKAYQQTYGLFDAEHKTAPQSGFAKKLDRDAVLKENRRVRKFFAKSEQDLYHNLAVTLKAYPIPAIGQLDEAAELKVDFAEPTFEEDPQNQARIDALELKMNKISIIDILARENPDLTEVELVQMAHRNQQINKVFMTNDQMRMVDLLATRTMVGASLDKGGGGGPPGADGAPADPNAPPLGEAP